MSPWQDFGRGLLAALQLTAMGLCAIIVSMMLMEHAYSIPPQMCIGASADPMPEVAG